MNYRSRSTFFRSAAVLGATLLLVLGALALCALRLRLPAESTGSKSVSSAGSPGTAFSQSLTGIRSSALEGLAYVEMRYKLAPDLLVAPAPDPAAFGETSDKAEIRAVIDDAAELLDGQDTLWNEEIELKKNSSVHYYRDETILALTWQEYINSKIAVTFSEVKIADPSQFRRKLAEDTYGSTIQKFPEELAAECNAVLATSADFYRYQKMGIHVYQGELMRADGMDRLDTCFVDGSGDLLFVPHGTFHNEQEIRDYIVEHGISTSFCFGPIVIENGENVAPKLSKDYPLGEIGDLYSRTMIAQLDSLHYMVAVFYTESWLYQGIDILLSKGITHAYALDGGQTGSIILGGERVNPYQYGSARTMSDVMYFATAVPEDKRS